MPLDFSRLFTGSEVFSDAGQHNTASSIQKPPEGQKKAFAGYRELYRAAYSFHERNYPPENSLEYWQRVADDVAKVAAENNNNAFIIGLLATVYDDLAREGGQRGEEHS